MQLMRKLLFVIVTTSLLTASLSACSTRSGSSGEDLGMEPMAGMPNEVQAAPVTVQQAYQFAAANPEIMKDIPCYCGCGGIGHTSNYSCYVSTVDEQGRKTFDNHALGCSICVDITQDIMRLLRDGKDPQAIRTYVDTTYSRYGPSNIP